MKFDGDLKAFFAQMRTDERFKNRSDQQILDGHRAIIATMESNLPQLFGRLPRIPLEVRAFEPIRAKSSPTGEYYPAASDGSRPGIFFVNTSDPTSRPTYTMQALAYHEAIPGHHLQGALGLEAPGRPPFRRYFYFPAFDEGWALVQRITARGDRPVHRPVRRLRPAQLRRPALCPPGG